MEYTLLFTPLFVFLIFLAISAMIYWFGGALSLKTKKQSAAKLSTYACGEEFEGGKVQQSFTLFHVAFIFTIIHIAALIIATIPSGDNALFGLIFMASIAVSAIALITKGGARNA